MLGGWIAEHERGDISLGYVSHVYDVHGPPSE